MTGWMYDAAASGPRLRMFFRGSEAVVYLNGFWCCVSHRGALVQFSARTLWRAKAQCLFCLFWMTVTG